MPFGPNAINTGYGQSQNNPTGISNEVIPQNPAQTPGNFVITGGSIDGTPIGITTPAAGKFTTIDLSTPLSVANGGTGQSSTPSNGQLLIGNGSGFSLNTLVAGSGIQITNSSGNITLQTTGGSGTVTSVDVSGGTTGLTFNGGPVTTSGTISMAGILAIANGGTGAASESQARTNLGVTATGTDTTYLYRANNLSDLGSSVTARNNLGLGGLAVENTVNLSTTATGGVYGILSIANGGTSASTASAARSTLSAAVLGANNDITSLSGITGGISTVDYIDFDAAATPSTVAARVWWNDNDGAGTLNIGMKGGNVTQQVGEELFYRIKASDNITNGQVVMIDGSVGNSGQIKGKPANGLTINDGTKILGVATESASKNGWCFVTSYGFVRGIDTTGGAETWAAGDVLYYNPAVAGGLTKNIPTAPNLKVEVASVVIADASTGELLVRVHPGSVLGNTDSNVQFTTLTDNNFIAYSSSNSRWENLTPSASRTALGLGTIATQNANNVAITGGAINGTPIGSSTTSTGAFTTLSATGNILSSGGIVGYSSGTTVYTIGSGGYNGPVGGSTPAAGAFTTLAASPTGNSIQFQGSDGIIYRSGGTGTNAGFHRFRYFDTDVAVVSDTGLAVTGNISSVNSGTLTSLSLGDNAASSYSGIRMYGGSGKYNWLIGAQYNVDNGLEITPSTAVNGTTFTTPVAKFTTTGLTVTGTGTALTVNSTSASGLAAAINSTSANGTFFAVQNSGTNIGFIGDALNVNAGTLGDLAIRSQGTGLDFGLSGSRYMRLTSTGLAVTGTLGATGNVWSGNNNFSIGSGTTDGFYVTPAGTMLQSFNGSTADGQYLRRRVSDGVVTYYYRDTTQVGTISVTTTGTSYNVTSDARLKTNIRDLTNSGAIIDALKPRIFDWKSGASPDTYGFVAQETYAVFPQAVTKGDDGDEITQQWGVDFSKLVPVLVAELKALRARVAALEAASHA